MPESFRWLACNGRTEEAERAIRYVAKINRKPAPSLKQLQAVLGKKHRIMLAADKRVFKILSRIFRKFETLAYTFSLKLPIVNDVYLHMCGLHKAVLLLWFILIVIFPPLSVNLWLFVHFKDSLYSAEKELIAWLSDYVVLYRFLIIAFTLLYYSLTLLRPRHDKTNKMSVRPAKTQISLGIRPVWSESSLCA